MAYQLTPGIQPILGIVIYGDVGLTTMYKDKKGRMIVFDKTFPQKPPSPLQTIQRQRFTDAAAAWQALTAAKRAAWELASKRASLAMTGYNMFVHWHTLNADTNIRTIERQTGVNLLP